jgi:hypothetical protein
MDMSSLTFSSHLGIVFSGIVLPTYVKKVVLQLYTGVIVEVGVEV